jgi:DDE superfamily endonuclease
MSGKKRDKFRITMAFACNADGSEHFPPIYIGRSKKPRCFKGWTPAQLGLYYQNNKTAWMTSELFEECVFATLIQNDNQLIKTLQVYKRAGYQDVQ